MSHEWKALREKFGIQSRGKSRSYSHAKAHGVDGCTLNIPIENYPAVVPCYLYGTAKALSCDDTTQPYEMRIIAGDVEEYNRCMADFGWDGTYQIKDRRDVFARFVAKVAYGWFVSITDTLWLREKITPVILGRDPDYTRYVGGVLEGYEWNGESGGGSNKYKIWPLNEKLGLVVIDVSIISNVPDSRYHVVIGECDIHVNADRTKFTFRNDVFPDPETSVKIKTERPQIEVSEIIMRAR